MNEGGTQADFVVSHLALRYAHISRGLLSLRLSTADEAFDGVEDRTGAVKVPGELGISRERSGHRDLRRSLRMENKTEGQTTIHAQWDGVRLRDESRKRFELEN